MLFYIVLALGIVATVVFLIKRNADVKIENVILKAIASVLFIFTTLAAMYSNPSCPREYGFLIVCGACFGLFGDIWLDMKYAYSQDADKLLKAGFLSFLVGHIFYSAAMVYAFELGIVDLLIGAAGAVIIAVFTATTEKLLKVQYGKFKILTVTYMAFLGFTVALSFAAVLSTHCSLPALILFIGMVLFIASDAVLSGTYFGEGKTRKFDIVLNHTLYYAAQYLIAASVFAYNIVSVS